MEDKQPSEMNKNKALALLNKFLEYDENVKSIFLVKNTYRSKYSSTNDSDNKSSFMDDVNLEDFYEKDERKKKQTRNPKKAKINNYKRRCAEGIQLINDRISSEGPGEVKDVEISVISDHDWMQDIEIVDNCDPTMKSDTKSETSEEEAPTSISDNYQGNDDNHNQLNQTQSEDEKEDDNYVQLGQSELGYDDNDAMVQYDLDEYSGLPLDDFIESDVEYDGDENDDDEHIVLDSIEEDEQPEYDEVDTSNVDDDNDVTGDDNVQEEVVTLEQAANEMNIQPLLKIDYIKIEKDTEKKVDKTCHDKAEVDAKDMNSSNKCSLENSPTERRSTRKRRPKAAFKNIHLQALEDDNIDDNMKEKNDIGIKIDTNTLKSEMKKHHPKTNCSDAEQEMDDPLQMEEDICNDNTGNHTNGTFANIEETLPKIDNRRIQREKRSRSEMEQLRKAGIDSRKRLQVVESIEGFVDQDKCKYCNKQFRIRHLLRFHESTCQDTGKIRCSKCPTKRFLNVMNLVSHRKITHKDKTPWHCCYCTAKFSTGKSLRQHQFLHYKDPSGEKWQCYFCFRLYEDEGEYQEHTVTHQNQPRAFECQVCNNTFLKRSHLVKHLLRHEGRREVSCSICNKQFVDDLELKVHMKKHLTATRKCSFCRMVVKKDEYQNHCNKFHNKTKELQKKRTVREKRDPNEPLPPAQCSTCGKILKNKYVLKSHEKRHLKLEQQNELTMCKHCGKAVSVSAIAMHEKRHVMDTKQYVCSICGKKFEQKANLTTHFRTHTGEKPYKCEFCGQMFSQPSSLNRHKKIHTGVKKHVCEICGWRFIQKVNLDSHRKTHTGEVSQVRKKKLKIPIIDNVEVENLEVHIVHQDMNIVQDLNIVHNVTVQGMDLVQDQVIADHITQNMNPNEMQQQPMQLSQEIQQFCYAVENFERENVIVDNLETYGS